ncbi:MAG: FecR domain-containing protein [Bacteroidales bacterium]
MEEMDENRKYELIIRQLNGTASSQDTELFNTWLNSDPANRIEFEKISKIWHSSTGLKFYRQIDTETSLRKVKKKLKMNSGQPSYLKRLWPIWSIAATILLIATYFVLRNQPSKPLIPVQLVKIEAADKQKTITLPDNSVITLNSGSAIEYNIHFNQKERFIKFSGEAYFEISHNAQKAFIIETKNSIVKVIGTAFNLKARPFENTEKIVVMDGKVVYSAKSKKAAGSLVLEKGQAGVLNSFDNSFSKEMNNDPNFLSWKTGIFVFKDTPLPEALSLLASYYKCEFKTGNEEIKSMKITGKYENKELEELTGILALTLNLDIKKDGDAYILLPGK